MLASLAPRPARAPASPGGGDWMKYCIVCGTPIPEADDDLCDDCRAQLEELRDMADEEERWQTIYDWLVDHGLTPEDAADWADRLIEEREEDPSWLGDIWGFNPLT
ncbi:MAG: DUF2116 family Zn-ribbon domain-containing protein, partial [Chloroflexus sp.]|nr:DUF2116 family Zn-ribbon domain-containing protein [Chloroflexus sp.]